MVEISKRWTLGLDIGSASIGWALVDRDGKRLGAAGVRVFPAGVDDAKFEKGEMGSSNNTERRQKRLLRRQIRRRSRRQRSLFLLLQRHGLLPGTQGPSVAPDRAGAAEFRNRTLTQLDQELNRRWTTLPEMAALPAPAQVLPYFLRARALDAPLRPEELGRVFYHLGQRRGFKSNRREARTDREGKKQAAADDKSKVKAGINTLQGQIQAAGARTLGEHFARQDPADPDTRIRRRWTGRAMLEAEFGAIWAAQAPHHPCLTPELRERVWRLLYFQRPVGAGNVGRCELERSQLRAPAASLAAQRFRLLQKVNDLRFVAPDLSEQTLDASERAALLGALERQRSLTFSEIKKRKLVAVPKGYHFNLEHGGEKKLPGNQTACSLRKIFGEAWDTMPAQRQDAAVDAWLLTEDEEKFTAIGRTEYGLEGDKLALWNELQLPEGYIRLSLRALQKLLPLMEQGVAFKTAENQIYGDRFSGGTVSDQLQPVRKLLPSLANPAVMRALSELRQLVNAIVREYGKPYEIRIELARDLKRNAEQRARLSKSIRDQEKRNQDIARKITAETGLAEPNRKTRQIGLLYAQSGGQCPYCGGQIGFHEAFDGEVAEIDHILPRSKFPDDSFGNKVLAHTACNRKKSGRTPFEAFGSDPGQWAQVLERVRKWGDEGKQHAFQITDSSELNPDKDGSFAARRLNDTRYATTLAARYLGELYGGRDVAEANGSKRRVIHATSGMATATLRRAWGLEAILAADNAPGKNRLDHRHHAVDAVAIALTSTAMIQQLSLAAAADASGQGRVSSKTLVAPWPDFVDSVSPVIKSILVSHRPNHRLRGSLHKDTVYSRPHPGPHGEASHVRRAVHDLKAADVDDIVDATAREAVRRRLAELGTSDPKNLEGNWPVLHTRAGASVPIRRVRVRDRASAGLTQIGTGASRRWVSESGNHHIALFAGRDPRGRERWACRVVSVLEASRRKAHCPHPTGERCDCVVSRDWDGEGEFEFQFSLMKDDLVLMRPREGSNAEALYVVRKFSGLGATGADLSFVRHDRAGLDKELRADGHIDRVTSLNDLGRRGCRKVALDVLGRLMEAKG